MSQAHRIAVVMALGLAQILAWGTSFYFPAVFAGPIIAETGWSLGVVVGGVSIGLLVAGLVSPAVGRAIDRHGGRPVLASSSLLYASGLIGVALAQSAPVYLAAWVVVGFGMGTGLYDAVFAALGKLYGREARGAITNLTLVGGLASTVSWPMSAWLIEAAGWRGACLIYAALHLAIALPGQLFAMRPQPPAKTGREDTPVPADTPPVHETAVLILIVLVFAITSAVGAIVIVHLLIFLQARGIDAATSVWIGALFGPAQIAARIVERIFGARYHPVWTMVASCLLIALGLVLLWGDLSWPALVILLYGGGYGVSWIARGTLPLALFGPARFPRLMGKIAFPSLIAQALAPSLGALLVDAHGVDATIGVLTLLAIVNVVLIGALVVICRQRV